MERILTLEQIEAQKILVTALRSGNYTQEKFFLETQRGNCCLGVACREFMKHGGELEIDTILNATYFNGESHSLPGVVRKWLGFTTSTGPIPGVNLAFYNDNDESFDCIANRIEKTYLDQVNQM